MVNIQDTVVEVAYDPGNPLRPMFSRQRVLMTKYGPIHRSNGFHHCVAADNLDDKSVQDSIKHYAWCVVEELSEMDEALTEISNPHSNEEFVDALHFMLELCIASGVDELILAEEGLVQRFQDEDFSSTFIAHRWNAVKHLGLACNCLKNKRWKQTHHPVDRGKFIAEVKSAFVSLLSAWRLYCHEYIVDGDPWETLHNLYFKKAEVNKFRQESNY